MKRTFCLILAAIFVLSFTAFPALAEAGDSKTDPVEIIETNPGKPDVPGDSTKTPSSFAEVLKLWGITDPDVPFEIWSSDSGQNWSVVNLVLAILSVIFAVAATVAAIGISKNKQEFTLAAEKIIVHLKNKKTGSGGPKTVTTQYVRKKPIWKVGFFALLGAAAAVIVFILTENIWRHMCLFDNWTPLMVLILAVCIAIWAITRAGKELSPDLVAQLFAAKGAENGEK